MTPREDSTPAVNARHDFALALAGALAFGGCQWPTDDNAPPSPPVARVVGFRADPETPAAGDTVRLAVFVEDDRDSSLVFVWTDVPGSRFVPDGRPDGPRVKVVVPAVDEFVGNVSIRRPNVPNVQSVDYTFRVPVRPAR